MKPVTRVAKYVLSALTAISCASAPDRAPSAGTPAEVNALFENPMLLPYATTAGMLSPAEDLLARLEILSTKIFDGASGEARMGDLVALVDAKNEDAQAVSELLASFDLDGQERAALLELLRSTRLYGENWNPKHASDDDGIMEGPPLDRGAFSDWTGSDEVFQGAVLLRADMLAILCAEHDFTRYKRHVGTKYEEIGALGASLRRGHLDDGSPFAALRFAFDADLPFPFGSYSCVAQLFERIDSKGRLRAALWSHSSDFLWLASQDVYLPIDTIGGERVGYLLVRRYGFDLAGVPDSSRDRRKALRASLGNYARDVAEGGIAPPFEPDDAALALNAFSVQGLLAPKHAGR